MWETTQKRLTLELFVYSLGNSPEADDAKPTDHSITFTKLNILFSYSSSFLRTSPLNQISLLPCDYILLYILLYDPRLLWKWISSFHFDDKYMRNTVAVVFLVILYIICKSFFSSSLSLSLPLHPIHLLYSLQFHSFLLQIIFGPKRMIKENGEWLKDGWKTIDWYPIDIEIFYLT